MRLTGRRQSSNVDDRRRSGGSGKGTSLGVGSLIIAGVVTWLLGGNPLDVLQQAGGLQTIIQDSNGDSYEPTPEEEELAVFSSQILAGTEDIWDKVFKDMGRSYIPPKLVLFTNKVQSGCGGASSSTGPFYCPADQSVYVDLSFFMNMKKVIGADGDFAYAYVIAHEVGHHVQYLLGTLDQANSLMDRQSETEANKTSVRLELQADFYAGLWAYHDNKYFQSLEAGDIEEALNAASKIGDDYLQQQAYGTTQPESFNHGTSAQRSKWLKKGITTGRIEDGDTFTPSYNNL
ncbi:MAG: neutral zinc metallopeptidase [Marinilabiliaceae bacterium]|nr:neutral zinc metallopeptidase [Marinilabiliaceae bacterium]